MSAKEVFRTPDERFVDLPDFAFAANYREVTAADGTALRMHFLDEGPAAPIRFCCYTATRRGATCTG